MTRVTQPWERPAAFVALLVGLMILRALSYWWTGV